MVTVVWGDVLLCDLTMRQVALPHVETPGCAPTPAVASTASAVWRRSGPGFDMTAQLCV